MSADLRRARWAIAAAFLTQGLVFISLTTRLPRIQDRWDLGELALSGVLLMMVLLASLAVIVLAPSWPVAVLGFTLLGCGVAVVAPLSFSAAAALAGRDADPATRHARVDAVVARFNQFNYAGALLGAVMTGAVGASSLRIGFAVPLVLVLALFWLARAFAPADELSAGAQDRV